MSIQLGFQSSDFGLSTIRAVAAEFIATGLFVFIGVGSIIAANAAFNEAVVQSGEPAPPPGLPQVGFIIAVALTFGLAIVLLVAATAKISGGHLNPAVTFAAAATGRIKISTGLLYVVAQIGAAILAVLLLKGIVSGPFESGLGRQTLGPLILEDRVGDGAGAGLLTEGVLTFVLVFVVFATAMDKRGLGHLAPVAIGLAVLVDHMAGIPLTGASMNPARSIGPAVVTMNYHDLWIYILGPLIGAAIAALVYEYVFLWGEDGGDSNGEDVVAASPEPPPPPPPPPPAESASPSAP